jgi:acyl-CoA synthetase (AMP-forming)/AMP-acid ligase II
MALAEVLRIHARLRPTREAIVDPQRSIDYRTLDAMVNALCFGLTEAGIRRGDFVGVALRDNAEHVVTLMAMARLGAVIVPFDHKWSEGEKLSVAAHFKTATVLVDGDTPVAPGPWLPVDARWLTPTDRAYRDPAVSPESPLLLSLSSGTTGAPKGPCVSHQQFENRFMVYWINVGFTAYDRFVLATPLYFGAGRGFMWSMLFCGGTVALFPPPYRPLELVEYVAKVGGTATFLVPTILRRLLECEVAGLAFPTIEKLISSGSALYPEERRAIKQKLTPNLFEMYSSTEGGAVSVLGPGDADMHPDSVGRPCFRVQVEIVDGEDRPLPPGETGRLRYRSPASAQSYHAGDDTGVFKDGWYYPGDLAAMNADGFIFLKGRAKDMIIRGGVNVFPGDIEQVLLRSGEVREVAVVGIPSPEMGEDVGAFVVAAQPVDEARLISICQAELAPYKVPRRIFFVDSLPRHSGGKVVKSELLRMIAEKSRDRP